MKKYLSSIILGLICSAQRNNLLFRSPMTLNDRTWWLTGCKTQSFLSVDKIIDADCLDSMPPQQNWEAIMIKPQNCLVTKSSHCTALLQTKFSISDQLMWTTPSVLLRALPLVRGPLITDPAPTTARLLALHLSMRSLCIVLKSKDWKCHFF